MRKRTKKQIIIDKIRKKRLKIKQEEEEKREEENITTNIETSPSLPPNPTEISPTTPSSPSTNLQTEQNLQETSNPDCFNKYWNVRYKLFSKFDEGIQLDWEGWYSVTPEAIAKKTAERCRCDVIIDAFCGCGGNTIQFALTCRHVIAIDNNEQRLNFAKNNAKIYKVDDKIEFILGDFTTIAPTLKADVIFLSPPWGGPSYAHSSLFPLSQMNGRKIYEISREITPKIAYFMPRNIDTNEVIEMAENIPVEFEKNYSFEFNRYNNREEKKLKAITAYFDELAFSEVVFYEEQQKKRKRKKRKRSKSKLNEDYYENNQFDGGAYFEYDYNNNDNNDNINDYNHEGDQNVDICEGNYSENYYYYNEGENIDNYYENFEENYEENWENNFTHDNEDGNNSFNHEENFPVEEINELNDEKDNQTVENIIIDNIVNKNELNVNKYNEIKSKKKTKKRRNRKKSLTKE